MRLLKLSANKPSFRTVRFRETGISLVVGRKKGGEQPKKRIPIMGSASRYYCISLASVCALNRITMTRGPRSGRARKISGVSLIIAGTMFYLIQLVITASGAETTFSILMGFLAFWPFLTIGGLFLFWRGSQYAAKADAERILTDQKPEVLYLRSFRSDPSTAKYVFSTLDPMLQGLETQEEQLAEVLRPFGDLVAIGRPGEGLPEPGAARIYVSDDEWKEVVKRRMQAARLVIIRAGGGENLLWELGQGMETLKPEKLLILVLRMNVNDYESFRTKADSLLNVSLPEGAETLQRFGQVSGFIGFAADWKPSFFPLQAPYFRTSLFKPYRSLFKFALKPVFESFGQEWQPPALSVARLPVYALLGILIGVAELSWVLKYPRIRLPLVLLGALLGLAIGLVVRITRRREVKLVEWLKTLFA